MNLHLTLRAPWILAMLLTLAVASSASAQGRAAHYQPARPTMSPYIGYSNVNTTGLPSYYATVRPAIDYQTYVRNPRVMAAIRPETAVRTTILNDKIIADMVSQKIEMRATTGTGTANIPGTFQDYSHFYNPRTIPARR